MVEVLRLFTVTVALPVLSPDCDVQFASLKAVTVYVFVEDGLTVKVYGLVVIPVTLTGVVPSVYVRPHGCAPVNAILILFDVEPLHMD